MFQKLLENIAGELSSQNIPYMIIGGQAVLLYGEPRLTRDIDVTLGIGIDGLDRVLNSVKNLKFQILVPNWDNFVKETMVLPTLHEKSGIRVDFIFSFSAYEHQAIQNVKRIKLGSRDVCFAALEDVIIHKIIAGRPRDLEDVRSIILKNPDHNTNYIDKWLAEFDASLNENYQEMFKKILSDLNN